MTRFVDRIQICALTNPQSQLWIIEVMIKKKNRFMGRRNCQKDEWPRHGCWPFRLNPIGRIFFFININQPNRMHISMTEKSCARIRIATFVMRHNPNVLRTSRNVTNKNDMHFRVFFIATIKKSSPYSSSAIYRTSEIRGADKSG